MLVENAADVEDLRREPIDVAELRLPPSILPRFGDSVVWYLNASRQEGSLSGHSPGSKPVVRTRDGYTFPLGSYDQLRWRDPSLRAGPAWTTLAPSARISRPTPSEQAEFIRLLSQPIPPGPTYFELIEEIWLRGFEVFVVGGTVRDVIAGHSTNDVDLVTTMPLKRAAPLLANMYRGTPEIHSENGYVRLGGSRESGDPFIDLKNFVVSNPGTQQAVFGADFSADVRHRDFACNSVYYDPINVALFDPTGQGISDAKNGTLAVVCDTARPVYHRGQVAVRFIKFRCRGFSASAETFAIVRSSFVPGLSAMKRSELISYLYKQVFGKLPAADRSAMVDTLETIVCEVCGDDVWQSLFSPIMSIVLTEADE